MTIPPLCEAVKSEKSLIEITVLRKFDYPLNLHDFKKNNKINSNKVYRNSFCIFFYSRRWILFDRRGKNKIYSAINVYSLILKEKFFVALNGDRNRRLV